MSGLTKTVQFADSDFSGVSTGRIGERGPHFPNDQFLDSSTAERVIIHSVL